MSQRLKYRLLWLGILTVIVHVVVLVYVMPKVGVRLHSSYNQDRFADGYDELAANLAAGNGYRFYPETARTLMREPGYPMLLAGLRLMFGSSLAVVKLTNLTLVFVTAWLTMRIAMKLSPNALSQNPILPLIAPLLFLFHPGTLIAEGRGGIEIIFALLLTLYLLTVYRAIENNRWHDYAVSGTVLGITVLVRSTPILFPCFLFTYLLLFGQRASRLAIFRNISVMIIAMLTVLSPWILRNYSLTGKFVPTSSVLGVSAQAGQYIGEHLFEGKPFWLLDREAARERDQLAIQMGYPFEDGKEGYYQTFYKSEDEVRFSNYLLGRVITEYRRSPVLLARCLGQNAFNFWFAGKTWMATAVNVVVQLPFLIFAFIGFAGSLKTKQFAVVGPLVLLMGYIVIVHTPILAQARYSIPLVPLLSILASLGLVAALRRLNETGMALGVRSEGSLWGELTGTSAIASTVVEEPRSILG
jgi:hypothetical protein